MNIEENKYKTWKECYNSFMKTKYFYIYNLLGLIFTVLALISFKYLDGILQFILFVINMFLSFWLGSKKLFDKLEIYMNKYGYSLNKKRANLK